MGQGTLVIDEGEKDAGAELIDRISETLPVKLAFWLKPAESDQWFLYIAAEGIDDSKIDQGYEEVLRRIKEMRTPGFDPFRVKPMRRDDPLALCSDGSPPARNEEFDNKLCWRATLGA